MDAALFDDFNNINPKPPNLEYDMLYVFQCDDSNT